MCLLFLVKLIIGDTNQLFRRRNSMELLSVIGQELVVQLELLVRLIIACVIGMSIGFERKNRNKEAGIGTHAVVAFGAALIMIVSKYGFDDVAAHDASRIASQIVSGVGFLGAGIIFVKDNSSVSGLTTAAGIWATAGVGMSIGAGQYFIGICGGALLVVLQEVIHRSKLLSRDTAHATIGLTMKSKNSIHELQRYIEADQIEVASMKLSRGNKVDTTVEMELIIPVQFDKAEFLHRLADYPGVHSVWG